MTYDLDWRIVSQGTATAAQITAYYRKHAAGGLAYVNRQRAGRGAPALPLNPIPDDIGETIIAACQTWPLHTVNHDGVAVQSGKESAFLQSEIARDKLNPSGLGASNDDPYDNAITCATWQEGFTLTVAHLLSYAVGPGAWINVDPRWKYMSVASRGTRKRWVDLNGYWAVPGTSYGQDIIKRANDWLGDTMPPTTRLIDMFDHVPTIDTSQVLLPDEIEDLPNFPHEKLTALQGLTFHQTGNPREGANAQAHRNFVANGGGAKPAEGYEGVSYQWTVDDEVIIQITPEDEACWHAGNSIGNRTTNAIEMCINSDGDYYRTLYNAAYWGAWMQQRHGIAMPDKKQHNAWSGKNCPKQIRERGEWDWFIQGIEDWRSELDTPTETEAIINGYTVKGPFLAKYRALEAIKEHWQTIGVPTGEQVPGVIVDSVSRIVQPFDRAPFLMTEDAIAVVPKPEQVRQIRRELGIETGTDIRVAAVREAARAARDQIDVILSEVVEE